MVDAFSGKLGGPLADLAKLIGERSGRARADRPRDRRRRGDAQVGDSIDRRDAPVPRPDGSTTTLNNSIFSTVPGSPAYVGVADHQRIDIPEHGYSGRTRATTRSSPTGSSTSRRVSRARRAGRRPGRLGGDRGGAWALRDRGPAPSARQGRLHHDALIEDGPGAAVGLCCSCSRGR